MAARVESAAAFFAASVLAVQDVPLPDGKVLQIRELSVGQRAEFSRAVAKDRDQAGAWVVAQCCLTPSGARLFEDDDIPGLMASSPRFVEFLAGEILKFSGLVKDKPAGNV